MSRNEWIHTSAALDTSLLARYSILLFIVMLDLHQITDSKGMFRKTDSQVVE